VRDLFAPPHGGLNVQTAEVRLPVEFRPFVEPNAVAASS
jgi:hypothetical protein